MLIKLVALDVNEASERIFPLQCTAKQSAGCSRHMMLIFALIKSARGKRQTDAHEWGGGDEKNLKESLITYRTCFRNFIFFCLLQHAPENFLLSLLCVTCTVWWDLNYFWGRATFRKMKSFPQVFAFHPRPPPHSPARLHDCKQWFGKHFVQREEEFIRFMQA